MGAEAAVGARPCRVRARSPDSIPRCWEATEDLKQQSYEQATWRVSQLEAQRPRWRLQERMTGVWMKRSSGEGSGRRRGGLTQKRTRRALAGAGGRWEGVELGMTEFFGRGLWADRAPFSEEG